jgi:pantothenate kinase
MTAHTDRAQQVELREDHAAQFLASRIVERIDGQNTTTRLDFGAAIAGLVSRSSDSAGESRGDDTAGQSSTERLLVGIVGAPGAGKSTITAAVAELRSARGIDAAILPMDGFHLSNVQLGRLGLSQVKGAPQTFDSAGFVGLLRRIVQGHQDVYVPVFHREIEESYAADGVVSVAAQVVLIEGNYLLLDDWGFEPVRSLLSESWYLAPDEQVRIDRLVLRHVHHGRSPQDAIEWALGTDQRNAELIAASRDRADLIVHLT